MTTRAQVESILVFRRGKAMVSQGLDGTTVDGTNPDLTDSIGSAIRWLGGTTADPLAVTDGDISTIPEVYQGAIFDAAEMYLLNALRGQYLAVDQVTGPFQAKLSQLPDRWLKDWELLRRKLEDEFGLGGPELEAGVFEHNFAAHGEDDDSDV